MAVQTRQGLLYTDFSPSIEITAAKIDKLGLDIRSFKVPLQRSIKQVMAPSFTKNFDSGGRPSWAPISQGTVEFRELMQKRGFGGAKRKGGASVLVLTGALRRTMGQLNIWTVNQETATITDLPSSVWYGKVHQAGYSGGNTSPIPARPFVMFQPEDIDKIAKVFDDWLEERIERAWPK